ncbi:MAG: Fur family ferric uptake transcriptional regulator, partial [Flavobacteriales bacterium]
ALLRKRNLKATATRIKVLSIIDNYSNAIPFSNLQSELDDFDRVTLYRTIQSLVENGIIHKALTEANETYYALCDRECSSGKHNHDHVHFKCTSCDVVSCVLPANPIGITIPNHIIDNFKIEATGICVACAQ